MKMKRFGQVLVVVSASASLLSLGCFGGSRSGGSSSSSGGEDFTGSLTLTNDSGMPICGLEVEQDDHLASHSERIEPGESVSVDIESRVQYVWATNCDGDGFVYADSASVDSDTYSIEAAPQSYAERIFYLRRLNRMNANPAISDPALEAELHRLIQQAGQSAGWEDEQLATQIVSDDWGIVRNNRTGIVVGRRVNGVTVHQFDDGHCTIQIHAFYEEAIGEQFTGNLRYEGPLGPIGTGCSIAEWMGGSAGTASSSSSSSSSSGGGCTNTCSSANDGECDDGGPGAEYAVCALGTDCADCGSR